MLRLKPSRSALMLIASVATAFYPDSPGIASIDSLVNGLTKLVDIPVFLKLPNFAVSYFYLIY